mmetsp:Transcript_16673/g.45883  ORF Transcript_16673/g.45883 Transcript_16673/m.45883 type:complete len:222 (+) Transcript_16673:185-850(+)
MATAPAQAPAAAALASAALSAAGPWLSAHYCHVGSRVVDEQPKSGGTGTGWACCLRCSSACVSTGIATDGRTHADAGREFKARAACSLCAAPAAGGWWATARQGIPDAALLTPPPVLSTWPDWSGPRAFRRWWRSWWQWWWWWWQWWRYQWWCCGSEWKRGKPAAQEARGALRRQGHQLRHGLLMTPAVHSQSTHRANPWFRGSGRSSRPVSPRGFCSVKC